MDRIEVIKKRHKAHRGYTCTDCCEDFVQKHVGRLRLRCPACACIKDALCFSDFTWAGRDDFTWARRGE